MARRQHAPVTLSPDKWANLNEAFHQVRSRLGSDQPTERDLTRDLRNGDLIGATRQFLVGRDRTTGARVEQETVVIRPASFWNNRRVVASRFYGGATLDPLPPRGTHVFIRRDELDKRYPRELPAAAQSDNARPTTTENKPRRKRGSRERDAIRKIAAELWPDGFEDVGNPELYKEVTDVQKERKKKIPGQKISERTTVLRALDRRNG